MRTLADFKRRLVPGLPVTVTFYAATIRGNVGDTVIPAATHTRKVWQVTPSCVIWESMAQLAAPGSRLYWPRADCLTFSADGNTVAIAHEPNGQPFAVYSFAP